MDDMRAVFIFVGFFAIVGIFFHGWRSSARANNNTQNRQAPAARAARNTPAQQGRDREGRAAPKKPHAEPHMSSAGAGRQVRADRQEPILGHGGIERVEPSTPFLRSQESTVHEEHHDDSVVAFEQTLPKVPEPEAGILIDEPPLEESIPANPDDILVLHVVSKDQPIQGTDLLHNLMTIGLRFGEMDIFHMHKSTSGTGPIMFSLVNMMNPGTFNIDEMEQFTTEGVALFMTLPCDGDARVHFSRMQGVAKGLADMHNAEVQDEHRQPWNDIKADAYLARIDKFEKSA